MATFARGPWPVIPSWAAALVRPWLFRIPLPEAALRRSLLGDDAPRERIVEVCEELRRCRPEVLAARIRDVLRVDVRHRLRHITVPMLYIGGRRDRVVPRHAARELKCLRPDIDQFYIDSPHAVLQCRPTESAALIASFLLERHRLEPGTNGAEANSSRGRG